MPKVDSNTQAHLDWMGFVQPQGLVVSAPALTQAGVILNRNDAEGQNLLQGCVDYKVFGSDRSPKPWIPNFETFARRVLGWGFSSRAFAGYGSEAEIPEALELHLSDYGETLRPDCAVRLGPKSKSDENETPKWQMLVRILPPTQGLDKSESQRGTLDASPQSRMERLLRAVDVPAGLIFNGRAIRLVSAPPGEGSGWIDFQVADMLETAGRLIVGAMRLLLGQVRLLAAPTKSRLPTLLRESRNYQNVVSERLAEQVLHALYELVRGFQAAQDFSGGKLLEKQLARDPDEVYRALLTVLLRLVFLLYAEQRDMLPDDETYVRYYSVAGLYDRLREDAAQHPDTMDLRYGAWAQLIAMFRMIHDGAKSGAMSLPARKGGLFDPKRFEFLEGGEYANDTGDSETLALPGVPDGTVHRVLEKLFVLDGERISYRALDVEQIGSVYETMMGFRLETATGTSVAVKATKRNGAPSTIDLDALLTVSPGVRRKWIQDHTDRRITDRLNKEVRQADSVNGLHAALDSVLDKNALPDRVFRGAMVLQPSQERRRSGSHYTPRSLTEPIVRDTLGPVLDNLREESGQALTPEQILEIKVCDPAMGSGAFLVEACRQLGDALVEAWRVHGTGGIELGGQDDVLVARRMVVQRCLFGVDRNRVAVDLAKMSLWLATLARDHPLTFVDHALRHGDSLVGLSRKQIERFHWSGTKQLIERSIWDKEVRDILGRLAFIRDRIRIAPITTPHDTLTILWQQAQAALANVRLAADLVLDAFFHGGRYTEEARREAGANILSEDLSSLTNPLDDFRDASKPIASFHWEVEFPEVFSRDRPGFDAIIGNPPFAGKNTLKSGNVALYQDWLKQIHADSHGNADLVAHFFRRSYMLLRDGGCVGLIATNTIAQGDTRFTGLRWICTHGGEIYQADRRMPWPGQAAVIVSVVHIYRGQWQKPCRLDGVQSSRISAFLVLGDTHEDPVRLRRNQGQSFQGSIVLGMGFTFDDTNRKDKASSLSDMYRLISENPQNKERLFPYIGGKELNSSPTHMHHRYAINFEDLPLRRDSDGIRSWFQSEARDRTEWLRRGIVPRDYPLPVAEDWPSLLAIVENKVRPERIRLNRKVFRERWWHYARNRPGLYRKIMRLQRVLAISSVTPHFSIAFLPTGQVYSNTLILFPFETYAAFCILQSRVHEIWARHFGSSLEDRLRYTPTDCFETFPFPSGWSINPDCEQAGQCYYEFRSSLMKRTERGLTATYNRFHSQPDSDSDIARLREFHDALDRAVLDSYGWNDISTMCEFVSDHDLQSDTSSTSHKSLRYRWPNEIQDEVLGRLIALSARYEQEEEGESDEISASRVSVIRRFTDCPGDQVQEHQIKLL